MSPGRWVCVCVCVMLVCGVGVLTCRGGTLRCVTAVQKHLSPHALRPGHTALHNRCCKGHPSPSSRPRPPPPLLFTPPSSHLCIGADAPFGPTEPPAPRWLPTHRAVPKPSAAFLPDHPVPIAPRRFPALLHPQPSRRRSSRRLLRRPWSLCAAPTADDELVPVRVARRRRPAAAVLVLAVPADSNDGGVVSTMGWARGAVIVPRT